MLTGHGECVRAPADIGCRDASTEVLTEQATLVALRNVATPLLQGAPYKYVAGWIAHACNSKRS